MSFETQPFQVSSSFFVCLSRKALDRFFILLHHCFHSYKRQPLTKQTGLTSRFVIPPKYLCSCVQKIKNKQDSGENIVFLLPHEEKINKSKTTTLTHFDNLKKKQQDQGGKN